MHSSLWIFLLLPVLGIGCASAHSPEEAAPSRSITPTNETTDSCPHWFLLERDGPSSYERREYDAQMRVVFQEDIRASRTRTGELHRVVETSFEDGRVIHAVDTSEEAPDGVVDFRQIIDLDSLGRIVRLLGSSYPDGDQSKVETRRYDEADRLIERHIESAFYERRCSLEYDRRGLLSLDHCARDDFRRYGWDAAGRLSFRELQTGTFDHRTTFTHEGDRLVEITHGDDSRSRYRYDGEGRLLSHQYTREGGGHADEYTYDTEGRMVTLVQDFGRGSSGNHYAWTYDDEGRLASQTLNERLSTFEYERSGDVLTVTTWRGDEGEEIASTSRFLCSETAATGLPREIDPEPELVKSRSPALPENAITPVPSPTRVEP